MVKMRTIVIGDIHGCYEELKDLIEMLEKEKEYNKVRSNICKREGKGGEWPRRSSEAADQKCRADRKQGDKQGRFVER